MTTRTSRALARTVLSRLDALIGRTRRSGKDRGDVPGWVLITVMTAGLVTVLWSVASSELSSIFESAVSAVTGP